VFELRLYTSDTAEPRLQNKSNEERKKERKKKKDRQRVKRD
jgi:hypothetical protein